MSHSYLTQKDIDVARIIKQITQEEVKELKAVIQRCKTIKSMSNIILKS